MEEMLFLLLSNLKYFLVAVCKNTIRSINLLLSLTRVMGESSSGWESCGVDGEREWRQRV